MKLIMVRHAHDIQGGGVESELSWQGRRQARETAEKLVALGFQSIDVALSSPAKRASQTLDEMASILSLEKPGVATELQPSSDVSALEHLLWSFSPRKPDTVILVGHEPQLSNAILQWCGLPDNDQRDDDRPPWILSRGEAVSVCPDLIGSSIHLHSELIQMLGRQRPLPNKTTLPRAGVF